MKVVTLMENTACADTLAHAHGLSLYIETPRHKVLFDMGPNEDFLCNAKKLGVDLAAVDIAVLSHGHYDHGGGLRAFCGVNARARILIRPDAFGDFYALDPGKEPEYIGLAPDLRELEGRFLPVGTYLRLDEELSVFSDEGDRFPAMDASAKLREKVGVEYCPDRFTHEQNLLVESGGKAVLFAGCAHRGIVNILAGAKAHLGRAPDAVFGGFHFFQLDHGTPEGDALITSTARALLPGETVYYTGHCTGRYAYDLMKPILGGRLRPMTGGGVVEI